MVDHIEPIAPAGLVWLPLQKQAIAVMKLISKVPPKRKLTRSFSVTKPFPTGKTKRRTLKCGVRKWIKTKQTATKKIKIKADH